jgi:hypothetical protein
MRPRFKTAIAVLVCTLAGLACGEFATEPGARDALGPGTSVSASVVPAADVLFYAEVTDVVGDNRFPDELDEDLVYGSVALTADEVIVEVRLAPGTFGAASQPVVALDLDQNQFTGLNREGIGSDVVVVNGTMYDDPDTFTVLIWDPVGHTWDVGGTFPLDRQSDGWRVTFSRSLLGGDDGLLNFRMEVSHALDVSSSTQWLDAMPDRPATVSTVALTPEVVLGLLEDAVDDLEDAGSLSPDQAAGLRAKLAAARARVASGNTTAACNQLNAFIHQVEALVRSGSLAPEEGAGLIEGANRLRARIGC